MIGILAFAFAAGSVATVNPCGFALLPAYLARRMTVGTPTRDLSRASLSGVAAGAAMTSGFVTVFGLGGGAVALGAGWLAAAFPWIGLTIGLGLIAAGLYALSGRRIGPGLILPGLAAPAPAPPANGAGLRGDFVFGLGYAAASLSCTLPIFLAVVGAATSRGPLTGVLGVLAYALGMGSVVGTLAVAAAWTRSGIATACAGLMPYVTRIGGLLLLLSGAYVAYFWGSALGFETLPGGNAAVVAGERVSAALRSWLGGGAGQAVAYAALTVLFGLSARAMMRRRRRSRSRIRAAVASRSAAGSDPQAPIPDPDGPTS
ncbi:MAG: cytochrome c biogenesis protein CcdA [Alphaproteobacteria bacterium]|nr:MAG: cytochrome c biogenesis protein CcdA [Alphaproteobacteria bacterium]